MGGRKAARDIQGACRINISVFHRSPGHAETLKACTYLDSSVPYTALHEILEVPERLRLYIYIYIAFPCVNPTYICIAPGRPASRIGA